MNVLIILLLVTVHLERAADPQVNTGFAQPLTTLSSPTQIGKSTPYPTPKIDLRPYLHEQGGRSIVVSSSVDLGKAINDAEAKLGPSPGKIIVRNGGTIKTPVIVSHDLDLERGIYACDTESEWSGCVLLKDNVKVEAKGDVTFLEPTYVKASHPAITVFQSYAASTSNEAMSQNITVKGFKIRGRQTRTDGGVRQSISFGNCHNCAAIDNDLSGIASIGIQWGGSAKNGNHAVKALAYRNKLRRFAAAAIALVNVDVGIVAENDIAEPGRKVGEPGGISGIDIETNDTDDCARNIAIFNNHIDYSNAAFFSIGNGILGQNAYYTNCSGGLLIANNVIDGFGGRTKTDTWGLSSGLYFVGQWPGALIVNNQITRALQMGLVTYSAKGLTVRDNSFRTCGGGGNPSIYLIGGAGNSFVRNRIWCDKSIPGSCDPATWQTNDSVANKFQNLGEGGLRTVPNPIKR